ncbi:hypothetical protein DET47_102317 [Shewanella putrefaciens]|nr:hypothetical protein DET47_102317 [Shewanella putrefaciens]
MLKKWTMTLIPLALLGLSGCASTNNADSNTSENKVTKECNKVTSTGSNIGRCKK